MFKIGDIVFVSNPDKEYEEEYGVRDHKSFFGKITDIINHRDSEIVDFDALSKETTYEVLFPSTPKGCEMEWSYNEEELSLASELKDMTLEEFSNKFGVSVLAEYL